MIDDHNNLHHAFLSIEDLWKMTQWENWVFAFILAVCEVNVYLFFRYFVYADGSIDGLPTLLTFVIYWHGNKFKISGFQ